MQDNDLSAEVWPVRRLRTDLWLAFGLYALVSWLSIAVSRLPGTAATVWLANGLMVALVTSAPGGRAVAMVAAAALGHLVANLAHGEPLMRALAFVPPSMLEVALGVWLVRRTGLVQRYAGDEGAFARVLLAGALLPPLAGATAGAATLHGLGLASFTHVWFDGYIGAALGAVATLPLGLALRSGRVAQVTIRLASLPAWLTLAATAAVTWAAARWLPFPFVAIGVALIVVAFARPRLEAFAAVALAVLLLALALALGVRVVGQAPIDHALFFFGALLAVLPAQVVAVAVARQRTLSRLLAAVGSRVDDIVTLTDLDGTLRWVNQARAMYWGVPNEQVLGRRPDETLPPEVVENLQRPMFTAAREGRLVRRLVEVNYPAKGRRLMDMSMQPARDEDGQIIGVLYCASDVTDLEDSRRELERTAQALRVSHRSLEQFVRMVSHDLREPLNTVTQFCSLIEQDHAAQLEGPAALYFGHVRQGAQRMRRMMDDLLHYVRLDQPQAAVHEAVDLDAVWADVCADLQALVQASGAQLHSQPPLGQARGHRALLTLALQNLVGNAIKFVAPGVPPQVRVSAEREGLLLRLSVADNGIGIEPQHLAGLGTPFRRLHTQRKYEGTGLGLALCRRVAQHHGGQLEIESTPGTGSRFTIVWPQG
ncbi:MAG: PAS domain-containing protein [Rubrivivax sp.]|nr:PAS domain-containing protein [Rubrivivax sp.]